VNISTNKLRGKNVQGYIEKIAFNTFILIFWN